jgi:hypothetical protein
MAKDKKEKFNPDFFVSPAGHPRDRIILHESAEATKGGRFFALNGYSFLAQSGVEIDIPRPVRLMLDTLIRTETNVRNDGNGHTIRESRNIPRFPYVLVKQDVDAIPDEVPSAEAIDKMEKIQKNQNDATEFP